MLIDLVIVRHGSYNQGLRAEPLSEEGKQQIITLADKLKPTINKTYRWDVHLASSTALRAIQTAAILAENWGLESFETDRRIWTGGKLEDEQKAEMDELIDSKKHNGCIALCTHMGVGDNYPAYFLEKNYGRVKKIHGLDNGEAIKIHVESGDFEYFSGDGSEK